MVQFDKKNKKIINKLEDDKEEREEDIMKLIEENEKLDNLVSEQKEALVNLDDFLDDKERECEEMERQKEQEITILMREIKKSKDAFKQA